MSDPRLKSFIERIERVSEDIKALQADQREIYSEAKGTGFCVKTMRKLIALRKLDAAERKEQEAMLEIYESALGVLKDEPLGQAAVDKARVGTAEAVRKKRAEPAEPLGDDGDGCGYTSPECGYTSPANGDPHPDYGRGRTYTVEAAHPLDIPPFLKRQQTVGAGRASP